MTRLASIGACAAIVAGGLACSRAEKTRPSAAIPAPSAAPTVAAVAPADAAPAASGCITVDTTELSGGRVTLEGTVYSGQHSHPNGSSFKFFGMRLPTARCVLGMDGVRSIDDVQLMSMDDPKIIGAYDGATARVTGTAFPEHTAWHTRPVVISVESIGKM